MIYLDGKKVRSRFLLTQLKRGSFLRKLRRKLMTDAGKQKIIMEETIQKAIETFEKATGLTTEELRIAQRFEIDTPIHITSKCVLR